MYGIYLLFTLLFIWFCVAGATLAFSRICPHYAIARSVAILTLVLLGFFLEHFVGFGSMTGVLPIVLGLSAIIMWKSQSRLKSREFVISEIIFVCALLYAFLWRFSFPSITPSSERMTDLFFISNYMQGVTLPPVDNWNPPHAFDYYYAFQHYGAALMGRIFAMQPGVAYNYAFALLGALPLTLVAFVGQQVFRSQGWSRSKTFVYSVLLTAAVAFGGNGLSPLLSLSYKAPVIKAKVSAGQSEQAQAQLTKRHKGALANYSRNHIIGAARYIGSDRDRPLQDQNNINSTFAKVFFPDTAVAIKNKKMVLPSENLGYQYFLGDYHPTVGGFFLLTLALALLFSLLPGGAGHPLTISSSSFKAGPGQPTDAVNDSTERWQKRVQGALTLCVPLMLITNTWTLPLLVFLILAWMLYCSLTQRPLYWGWLLGGGVLGSLLIYPFMSGFLTSTLATPVKWVPAEMHTPMARFLALHWPVLLLIGLGAWEGRTRKLAWYFSGIWVFLLILSELIYIDDPTAAHFSRTNTVMKWWGWIQVGVFISLGALLLGSSLKWLRWITMSVLLVITASAGFELARYWTYSGKFYTGYMEGHRWYTNTATNRQMFEYLEAAPAGVVLEPVLDNAYSNTSIYAIFNGKSVLLGWPSHLRTWHGDVPRIWIMKEEIEHFYKGEKTDALVWLQSHDVRYIVFSPKNDNKKFELIHQQIKDVYAWHEYEHSRKRHTGIWVRKPSDQ